MLPRARPERFPWFQCAGAFRRTTAPVIHPMGTSSRTLARIGIALDIACGIVLRPLLELLHQALQQPRARFDRGEQHVFMIRMCPVAIDAKPVQGRDAHSNREVPVRSTADSWCALEVEADLLCNGSGLVEREIDPPSTHERWPRDLARHGRFDVGCDDFRALSLASISLAVAGSQKRSS